MSKGKPINAAGYRAACAALAASEKPRVIVEVGVYAGALSAMLAAIPSVERLYVVDSWDGSYSNFGQEHMDGIARQVMQWAATCKNVTVLRMNSSEAAKEFADETIDFFHTDGNHSLAGIRADITLWKPKVVKGCVMSGDNYEIPTVAQGVDELLPRRVLAAKGRLWWART